jgi:hypothetical protein
MRGAAEWKGRVERHPRKDARQSVSGLDRLGRAARLGSASLRRPAVVCISKFRIAAAEALRDGRCYALPPVVDVVDAAAGDMNGFGQSTDGEVHRLEELLAQDDAGVGHRNIRGHGFTRPA